jgi:hypothetical protein
MKKIFSLILIIVMCFALTGCFGILSDISINPDGSGSIKMQVGYSEMTYQLIKSMENAGESDDKSESEMDDFEQFIYNGIAYYGGVQEIKFSSIEEFNSIIPQNQNDVETGKIYLIKESDGGLCLNLEITAQTADTEQAEMNMESFGISEEQVEILMNDAVMLYTINMPGDITQISGDSEGITIAGSSLTIDFLKLNVPTDSNIVKKYSFKTKGTLPQNNNVNNVKFSDVTSDLWFYKAIQTLAEGGLVAGVGQGRFSPDRGMKISEFCQLLVNAKGLESGADENGYWPAKAIKSCIDKGYINTHGDINPKNYDEVITREEAIAAMQIASGRKVVPGKNITLADIPDGDQISPQFRELVLQAYNSGITTGVNEQLKFSPKNKLTRAQVCQLFYNVNWTKPVK